MSKFDKLVLKLLSGNSDRNFDFQDLIKLLEQLGFELGIKRSHYIFTKEDVKEIVNDAIAQFAIVIGKNFASLESKLDSFRIETTSILYHLSNAGI